MNNGLRILLELSLSGPASFVILWVLVFTLAMVCTSVLVYLRNFKTKSEGITEFLTVTNFSLDLVPTIFMLNFVQNLNFLPHVQHDAYLQPILSGRVWP